jgi:hypothetical protein
MQRIASVFEQYDCQGVHRTGTDTDTASAYWLAETVRSAGPEPVVVPFSHRRIDPVQGCVEVGERRCDGLPLFDCAYTDAEGVTGQLGPLGSTAPLAVGELPPQPRLPEAQAFMDARRNGDHRAMVAVCGGPRFGMPPGLTLMNADHFQAPFGPPVLQVSSTTGAWLLEAADMGVEARVIAATRHTPVTAFNVEVHIEGTDAGLAPLVVMTPRSGWWQCASERGGGLACWLDMMRAIYAQRPRRTVWFVATTGHELGHLGLERFLHEHGELVQEARAWIHLGANFAAAVRPSVRFQASDAELETLGLDAMQRAGITPDDRTPVASRPAGEARNIFDGGGRYVSLVGMNGLFHHPDDRWPDAVDLHKTVRLIQAFTELGLRLAS